MKTNRLVTGIKEGQSFVDEPVYVYPKAEFESAIALSVRAAFDRDKLPRRKRPIVVGHNRVQLRWMKPDGKGGLVPRG